jgi:hypothetical protein
MNLNTIAKDLFNKIRGQFPQVTLGDSQGKMTTEPTQARFFDFDFKEGGNTLGKVSISISEEDGMVVMHSKDFVEQTDEPLKRGWFNFLKELRGFAKARVLGFDTRDITKSNLEKRDYDFLGKGKEVEKVSESNLYGTTKTSFQTVGEARLVIKHSAPVNPTVAGGRTHRIESLFIENKAGERFKYPMKHLNGARAMARHVSEGGNPFDDFGKHITEMSSELNQLRKFKTYMNRSNVMAEGLKKYQSVVDERIEEIKSNCLRLQKQTAYKESLESFSKSELAEVPEDVKKSWIDELTIKTFNEELQDVFPYIYKLVTERTAIEELGPDSFEAHGYQGSVEPRMLRYDLAGDFDQDRGVSEKDSEDIKNLLAKAGINADVQPDESRHQGVVIHTDASSDDVEQVLGGMIETIDNFHEFESAMESIVREDNGLFSQDADEQAEALEKLNTLMAKHFPAGVNGTNGIESLQGIIDDEELNDEIQKAASEDSDICIRPMIMDYVAQKDPTLVSKINTGDMKQQAEAITFEDIKPYVSMYKGDDGKMVYDVLDKDGESVEKFADAKGAMAYLKQNFDKLKNKEVHKENPETDYEGSFEYELYGDDGETAYGTIHYKAINGVVDPKSLQGDFEYEGNAKVDSDLATQMIQPGGDEHEEALKAAQEDYDYESKNKKESQVNIDDEYRFRDWLKKTHNKELHQLTPQEYMAVSKQYRDETGKKESTHPGEGSAEELAQTMWNNNPSLHDEFKDWQEYMNSEEFQMDVDKLRSKFGEDSEYTDQQIKQAFGILNDPRYKGGNYDGAVDAIEKLAKGLSNHPSVANALKRANEDNSLSNKQETVEDFVKSFFDYTSNQFPKGETAVLTSVEKKFGDSAVATAQETIQNLMANKDPEIAKIKKLAGVQ